MRHPHRSAALALAVAVSLTGCAALIPTSPLAERVIDVPTGAAQEVTAALTSRLDAAGATGVSIEADGDRLTVRYESDGIGVPDEVFTAPGVLGVRVVDPATDGDPIACAKAAPADGCRATTPEGEELRLGPSGLSNADVDEVRADVDQNGTWTLLIELTDAGGQVMEKISGDLACVQDQTQRRIAMLLDGEILTAPILMLDCGEVLPGELQVAGLADRADATRAAALMSAEIPEGVAIVSATG
jgi:preprotein translocase subunit SecD